MNGDSTSGFSLLPSDGSSAPPGSSLGIPYSIVPRVGDMTDNEANLLGLASYYDSGNRNIRNFRYDPNHTAQGYYQITNTNWGRLAPGLGITAPNAMAANLDDQTRVALALLRESGIDNWSNYNPRLREALAKGITPIASLGTTAAEPPNVGTIPSRGGSTMGGGLPPVDITDPTVLAELNKLGISLPSSAGAGGGRFAVDASGNLVDTSASSGGGGGPPPPGPGAFGPYGPPPGTPATPTQPPAWLSKVVGPKAAAAIGSAPRGQVGTGGTGFLGGLNSFFTNPMTQAAAQGYFAAAGAPRGTSPFGRVAAGGATAMGTLAEQDRMQQLVDPLLQQRQQMNQYQIPALQQQLAINAQTLQQNQNVLDDVAKFKARYGYATPEFVQLAQAAQTVQGNVAVLAGLATDKSQTPEMQQRATALLKLQLANPNTPLPADKVYEELYGRPTDPALEAYKWASLESLKQARESAAAGREEAAAQRRESAATRHREATMRQRDLEEAALTKEAEAAYQASGITEEGPGGVWGKGHKQFIEDYKNDPANLINHPLLSDEAAGRGPMTTEVLGGRTFQYPEGTTLGREPGTGRIVWQSRDGHRGFAREVPAETEGAGGLAGGTP